MGNNDYFNKRLRRVVDAKGLYHPATHGGPHFILATEKHLGEPSISMTHNQVLDKLHQMGEWAESTSGTYGESGLEPTIIIKHPKNIDALHKLASDLGQESAILSDGGMHEMHYYHGPNKGKIRLGQGTNVYTTKPKDNYTTLMDKNGNNRFFSHNFDFDDKNLVSAESKLKKDEGKVDDPISKLKMPSSVQFGLGDHHARMIRDVADKSGGIVHKRDLEKQNLSVKKAGIPHLVNGEGYISSQDIQNHIKSNQQNRYNTSHGIFDQVVPSEFLPDEENRKQRHSDELSNVFRLDATPWHINQLKDAGVYDNFKKMNEISRNSGHPVGENTIGWARYTVGSDGNIHIDEVQSDFGQSLEDFAGKQGREMKILGSHDDEDIQRMIDNVSRVFPDAQMEKVNKILLGDNDSSDLIHEAFMQRLRDSGFVGKQVSLMGHKTKAELAGMKPEPNLPKTQGRKTWEELSQPEKRFFINKMMGDENTPSAYKTKENILDWAKRHHFVFNKADGTSTSDYFLPYPVHIRRNHSQLPSRKWGYKRGSYGEIATQNNPKHQGKDVWTKTLRKGYYDNNEETSHVNVSFDTSKAREARDLAEQAGGTIHKKDLEKQGVNLKGAGIHHLVQGDGKIHSNDIQDHIDSLPTTPFHVSDSYYGANGWDPYESDIPPETYKEAFRINSDDYPIENFIKDRFEPYDLPDSYYSKKLHDFLSNTDEEDWKVSNPDYDPDIHTEDEKIIDYSENPEDHPNYNSILDEFHNNLRDTMTDDPDLHNLLDGDYRDYLDEDVHDTAREIMAEEGPSKDWLDNTARQEQRHNAELSRVMKLHVAPETLNKIKQEGLEDLYDELDDHAMEGHPTEHGGIGWVRYTNQYDHDRKQSGFHIDEIQSDRGSGLVSQMKESLKELGDLQRNASRDEHGEIDSTKEESDIIEAEEKVSKMKRLYDLLYGGKTHSQALHETFHQYMRDKGYPIGDSVHIWQVSPKANLSGQEVPPNPSPDQKLVRWSDLNREDQIQIKNMIDPSKYSSIIRNLPSKSFLVDKKSGRYDFDSQTDGLGLPIGYKALPVHMRNAYEDEPKKMGYKKAKYGELKTQNNSEHFGKDTWASVIRKLEEAIDLYPLEKDEDQSLSLTPQIKHGDETYHPQDFQKPLGVDAPVSVSHDTNPARMIRDLAEENGGVVHKKYLEKQGHNLKNAGIDHLVDAKGQIKSSDIQNHINSLPSRLYQTSHTTYGGESADYSEDQWGRMKDLARDMAREEYDIGTHIRETMSAKDLPNYESDYGSYLEDYDWHDVNKYHDPEDPDSEEYVDYSNDENHTIDDHPDFEDRSGEARDYVLERFIDKYNNGEFGFDEIRHIKGKYEDIIDNKSDDYFNDVMENFDELPEGDDNPDSEQRHSNVPSEVFQLNLSKHHLDKMKEAGVLDVYKKLEESSRFGGHPAKENTIGWARYTHDPEDNGIHIDEVQSDFDSALRKQINIAKLTPHEITRRAKEYSKEIHGGKRKKYINAILDQQRQYPLDKLLKIKEIMYGKGDHSATKLIHESFLQRLRNAGMEGSDVHIWDLSPKQTLSGQQAEPEIDKKTQKAKSFKAMNRREKNQVIRYLKELKPGNKDLRSIMDYINNDLKDHLFIFNKKTNKVNSSFRPAPVHMRQTYQKDPKKMGYKPDIYGNIDTQHGDHIGEPTWSHRLRKLEKIAGIIHVDPLEKDAKILQFPNISKEKVLDEHKKRKDNKEKSIELAHKFLQGSGNEDSHAEKLGRLFFRFPQHRLDIIKKLKELKNTNDHMGYLELPEGRIAVPNYHAKPTGTMGSKPDNFWNDVFSWTDINHHAGKKLLTEHLKINKPVDIHTSSDLISHNDYANLIPNGSTINFHKQDHEKTRGFPSDKRLFQAGQKLESLGHKVNYIGFDGRPNSNLTVLKREHMHRKFILNGSLTNARDSNYNLNKTQKTAGDAILRAMGKIKDPTSDGKYWSFLTKSVDIRTEGRVFVSMDGDNIGASVERAAMSDDLDTIVSQSELIFSGQSMIREWARKFNADVYIDGGDDMAFTLPKQHLFALKDLRSAYNKTTGFTVTIGVGDTISHAGHAMLYGKLHGKDQINIWSPELDAELETISKELTPHEKISGHGLLGKNENEIRLVHYGKQSGLNMIDPKNMGEGLGRRGNESRYGRPEVERSYYYREGSAPESIVAENANARYTATLGPEHRLYDIGTDPDKIHEKLKQASQSRQVNPGIVTSDQYLKAVKDAGYHGFHNSVSALPEVVALFHAHPVKEDETFRKGEKDEKGNVISIFKKKPKPKFKAKVSSTPSQARELGKENPNQDNFKKSESNYIISHVKTGTPQTFILEAHDNKGQKVARAYCINKKNNLSIHNLNINPNHQHKAKAIAEGFVSHAKKITGAQK